MEISFQQGTLVLAGSLPASLPGYVLWDPRVGRFRTHAYRLASLARWLDQGNAPWSLDLRRPPGFEVPPADPAYLPALRPYQAEALAAWEGAGRRGQIALPTGSGKTRLAIHALMKLGLPAIVLVPTRQLTWQWREALGAACPGPIGAYGDGEHALEPITVATYESAHRYLDRFGGCFDLLIVDEAHHLSSRELREACQMTTATARLGLTGTPPRDASARRAGEDLLGPLCFAIPLCQLQGNALADFEIIAVPLGFTAAEKEEYERCRRRFVARLHAFHAEHPGGTWAELASSSAGTVEGREAMKAFRRSAELVALPRAKLTAIDSLLALHEADAKIIFTRDNRSAYEISRRLLVPAITCEIARREREQILERFRTGVYRTLVSAKVLNEGLDVPAASVALIAGGSSGSREFAQRLGRVLRPGPGKKALVYDLVVTGTPEWRALYRRCRDALDFTPAV